MGRARPELVGDGLTALCGGALALTLLGVLGMLLILAVNGGGFFWQKELVLVELDDGSRYLGEIHERERIPDEPAADAMRMRMKVANRDLFGADFVWIDERRIVARELPRDAVLLERLEWGNFHGTLERLERGGVELARGASEVRRALAPLLETKRRQRSEVRHLAEREIGDVSVRIERSRLARRSLELAAPPAAERAERLREIDADEARLTTEYEALSARLFAAREELLAEKVGLVAADGQRTDVAVGEIVRLVEPNTMGPGAKLGLYASRLREFVLDAPRESNTEGGIFPAIFGTVMMVFIMSFVVAPFGVLAALYLREYAKQGPLVRLVRIAVNNLAGVPSIVFGVFGLGFFVYLVGGTIDRWFFAEALPAPTFGTGGILWASLTLALLTVPVVIVATEEGLAAVPRVVREGSLALGATRFETTWRVVLPAAAPGILTGLILAMARAAGEVAPLMIVGMVKLAPALPIDRSFPYLHLDGKFMHMGFHIYDVGFQSPNVEATKPLVFATALLLIVVVTSMNLLAIVLRNYLRAHGVECGIVTEPPIQERAAVTDDAPTRESTPPLGGSEAAPTAPPAADDPATNPQLGSVIFDVRDLSLWYGSNQALFAVRLRIPERKITAFIGPSGCGKSTLLRCFNRLNDLIDGVRIAGEILWQERSIFDPARDVNALRKQIGMVFQKSNPFPKSIYENVAYGPRIQGLRDRRLLDEIVERSLRGAALWDEVKDRLNDSALGLSGGQQQRLCIGRALAVEPDVILLDEPCSALDPIATAKIEQLMAELKERYTLIIVTHNMQQASRVSDYTAFLYMGRLIEYQETEKLFISPTKRQTEDYITGRFG